jgi:lipoyl(octanoyl) transferase
MRQEFNIQAHRMEGLTGVWIGADSDARKICAMGVKTSRWVTMHGLALNINTDLRYFSHIIPCGIEDKAVTSMQKELNQELDFESVKTKLLQQIISLFEMKNQV